MLFNVYKLYKNMERFRNMMCYIHVYRLQLHQAVKAYLAMICCYTSSVTNVLISCSLCGNICIAYSGLLLFTSC